MEEEEEVAGGRAGGRLRWKEAEVTVITSVFQGSRSSRRGANERPPHFVLFVLVEEDDVGRVSVQRGGQSCEQG